MKYSSVQWEGNMANICFAVEVRVGNGVRFYPVEGTMWHGRMFG